MLFHILETKCEKIEVGIGLKLSTISCKQVQTLLKGFLAVNLLMQHQCNSGACLEVPVTQ